MVKFIILCISVALEFNYLQVDLEFSLLFY